VKIYADTSALIAWFHPADQFAQAVTDWCRERSPEFSWNPLLRLELRHNLRRLSGEYAAPAWHAYRASETSRKLRRTTLSLSDLFERGDELSARHAQGCHAGTWDFVHVAAAQHVRAEIFVTCDAAQADLARVVGLPKVHLFQM
jgi:predicted nucleic acid-binding protein